MDGYTYVDIFAMKGPEYLMIIAMLALSVPFWLLIRGERPVAAEARDKAQWFRLPDGFLFHQGHAWAKPEAGDLVAVGVDEFARKLVGPLAGIETPDSGFELSAGEPGFSLKAGDAKIPVLSPVSGTVVEVNGGSGSKPQTHDCDPYGADAWLMKVKVKPGSCGLKGLLSGEVARKWMESVEEKLMAAVSSSRLGTTYADGGAPVSGMARGIDPQNWPAIAKDFLLVEDL